MREDFQVRDYECDLQGIVNNAVYQNYLEHARHEFLKAQNINFIEMHEKGLDLVIVEAHLKYIDSLKADDKFYVETRLEKNSRFKFSFFQDIYKEDSSEVLKAEMIGACINRQTNKPEEIF